MKKLACVLASAALLVTGVVTSGGSAHAVAPAEVLPTPQEVSDEGAAVALDGALTVVADDDVDGPAKAALGAVLDAAGATATWATTAPEAGTVVHFGVSDADTQAVAAALGTEDASGLAADGYVVANGTLDGSPTVLLEGTDTTGLFYAVQTLRQLVADGEMPATTIRDWPLMSIRGGIEGFYGIPWSHQARLDQLEFYGEHKMNTFIYTPKDDVYLRAQWRELYPEAELDKLTELVDEAKANHVEFVFALSPGNDICYSLESDFDATVAKFEQLRDIGVTSFYVALDDIDPYLKCAQDQETFTAPGFEKLADGQAHYLNRIVDEYVDVHGLKPLQTVPTNYAGSGPDAYKHRFGSQVDSSVMVQWTGEGVFSDQITMESVARAEESYNTDNLYIWDNFPVNDGQRDRIFLNPFTGRAPNLHEHVEGFTSNPMIQPYASLVALAGYADYTWNGPAYDALVSLESIIDELAGEDPQVREALAVFVDLNQDWRPYRPSSEQAPAFATDAAAWWAALDDGDEAGRAALEERVQTITALPATLEDMAEPGFHLDSLPWLEAASQWGIAVQGAMVGLTAMADGDDTAAAAAITASVEARRAAATTPRVSDLRGEETVEDLLVPKVGDGQFDVFLQEAYDRYEAALGATAVPGATPLTGTASYSAELGQWEGPVGNMTDGDMSTLWWSNAGPSEGSWVQLDLGSAQTIGSVAIHQAGSDTTAGDMFYDATLQYSADGNTWTDAGRFTDAVVVKHVFEDPVEARYVRLVSEETNDKWIQIREFQATGPVETFGTSIEVSEGSAASLAFDVDVQTVLTGTAADGDVLERHLQDPQTGGSVVVIGHAGGEVEVLTGAGWTGLGQLDPAAARNGMAVPDDLAFSAARLVFAVGDVAVTELIISTETITPPVEPTQEPTDEPSGQPTEEPTTEPSTTPTPTTSPAPTTEPTPTGKPTTAPTSPGKVDVYSEPGHHNVGGRFWFTECEPYSQTTRCTTEIWATQVELVDGRFVGTTDWQFNNLTYLPGMTREQWSQNPLGHTGSWVSDEGRRWRTECDTAVTGQGGCRSYVFGSLVQSSQQADGSWTHRMGQDWIFNNMVRFSR